MSESGNDSLLSTAGGIIRAVNSFISTSSSNLTSSLIAVIFDNNASALEETKGWIIEAVTSLLNVARQSISILSKSLKNSLSDSLLDTTTSSETDSQSETTLLNTI